MSRADPPDMNIGYPTVQRAESTDDVPRMKTTNLLAIQRVLEDAGVIFVDLRENREGGVGVRLKSPR